MAKIRDLKKDINYVLGDVIGEVMNKYEKAPEKSEEIIDEVITTFDDLIAKVNANNIEDVKSHFKSISKELEDKGNELLKRIKDI